MDSQSVSYKTLKNSGYGMLGYVVPILFFIVVTPVVIHRLGIVDYGVLVLVNTIMAFLGLLDLGFTVSLIKFVSEYFAQGQTAPLNKILNTGHSLYFLMGAVGLAVFYVIGLFFLPIFKISTGSIPHIEIVFLIAGLIFFINGLMAVYQVVPNALQRFDIITKLTIVQLFFTQAGTLAVVVMGYKLKAIFLVNLLCAGGILIAYRIYCRKILPQVEFGFTWDKQEIKKILNFGSFAALTNVASNALIQLDRLIIPIFLGPAQLSYYSVPGGAATKIQGFTSSLSGIFFPLSSSMQSLGQMDQLKLIYRRVFRNLSVIAAAMAFALIVFANKILFFWVGADFADKSTTILIILALTYYILALYAPLTNFLLGLGKVKMLAYNSVGLATLNLILMLILIPKMGIVGAAWAYLAGVIPLVFIFYWTEKKVLELHNISLFYLKLYGKLFFTAGVSFLLVKFLIFPFVNSFISLVFFGPASILIYLVLYKLFGFMDAEDWGLAKSFLRVTLKRFGLHKE